MQLVTARRLSRENEMRCHANPIDRARLPAGPRLRHGFTPGGGLRPRPRSVRAAAHGDSHGRGGGGGDGPRARPGSAGRQRPCSGAGAVSRHRAEALRARASRRARTERLRFLSLRTLVALREARAAEDVLGRELSPFDRSIDMHVSNLRKKLGHQLNGLERIKTIRGVGYIYGATTEKPE